MIPLSGNSVCHSLYEQFRVLDKEYAAFLDLIRYLQPTQQQLEEFQEDLVLCPSGVLADEDIFQAYSRTPDTIIMTVSRAASQRNNGVVTEKLWWPDTTLPRALRFRRGWRTNPSVPRHENSHNRESRQVFQGGQWTRGHLGLQPQYHAPDTVP